MKNLIKSFDDMPWVLKLILCLPVLDIVWAVYRICKGADTKNTLMLVVGILWLFVGTTITWIVDLVCTIVSKRPTFVA